MRIRTIKPEFWVSESLSRVKRDTRLLFVGLWSLADDHGRFRSDPRYIAGQLFPYDADGLRVVDRGLAELVSEQCVTLFEAGGSQYGAVNGWAKHQRIDRKSAPKLPGPDDSSSMRLVAGSSLASPRRALVEGSSVTREPSSQDQGRDQGSGKGSGIREADAAAAAGKSKKTKPVQASLPVVPPPPPEPLRPPSRIGRIRQLFAELREAKYSLPAPDGLELGPVPEDQPTDWGQSAAALSQWDKRWPDESEEKRDQRIESVILEWLETPYWASPKDKKTGKPSTPFPWGAFVSADQFDKACRKAFPEEAAA